MPNQNEPELTTQQLVQLGQVADQHKISDPGHLLVESMASPQIVANSEEGRDNFSPEAIRALRGRGHNYSDTRTLEQQLSDLHPAHSKAEDLDKLNAQLGNTVVIDTHISGGQWKGGW